MYHAVFLWDLCYSFHHDRCIIVVLIRFSFFFFAHLFFSCFVILKPNFCFCKKCWHTEFYRFIWLLTLIQDSWWFEVSFKEKKIDKRLAKIKVKEIKRDCCHKVKCSNFYLDLVAFCSFLMKLVTAVHGDLSLHCICWPALLNPHICSDIWKPGAEVNLSIN